MVLFVFLAVIPILIILAHLLLHKIGVTVDEFVSGMVGFAFLGIAGIGIVIWILWVIGKFSGKSKEK